MSYLFFGGGGGSGAGSRVKFFSAMQPYGQNLAKISGVSDFEIAIPRKGASIILIIFDRTWTYLEKRLVKNS